MKESSGSRFQRFVVNHFGFISPASQGGGVCDQLYHLLSLVISLSQGGARHRNKKKKLSVTKSVIALFITIYLS